MLMAEITRLIPTADRMNNRSPISSPNEPVNGIRKNQTAMAIIKKVSSVLMASAGNDLDRTISSVEAGDTSSWSKVPSSR